MRKTTAKSLGSVFLWLLVVLPVVLVLVIEKKYPDFESLGENVTTSGPLWNLAMFMSRHPFMVIWLGAMLVALAIWRWKKPALIAWVLLGAMALPSLVAAVVVAARYQVYCGNWNAPFERWIQRVGIQQW